MQIKRISKLIHDELGAAMVYIAPILAPMPSAWAIWTATGSPVLAAAVEGLGFSATSVALRTYSARRKGDDVPLKLAVSLCVIYGVAVLAVLAGKEVLPTWAAWRTDAATVGDLVAAVGTLTYPLLTAVGAGVYALTERLDAIDAERTAATTRADAMAQIDLDMERRRREMELDQAALDAEAKREVQRLKVSAKLSGSASTAVHGASTANTATSGGQPSTDDLLDIWRRDPHASLRTVADTIGMSKSWVGARRKELEEAGVIHVNGKVVVK